MLVSFKVRFDEIELTLFEPSRQVLNLGKTRTISVPHHRRVFECQLVVALHSGHEQRADPAHLTPLLCQDYSKIEFRRILLNISETFFNFCVWESE